MSDYGDIDSGDDEPVFEEPNSDIEAIEEADSAKEEKNDSDEDEAEAEEAAPALIEPTDDQILIIVHGDMRITSSIITLEEITRVIGTRATQIDNGAEPYVDITGLTNVRSMALEEVYKRKCPLSIRRELSPTLIEEWTVNEMELPNGYKENNPV